MKVAGRNQSPDFFFVYHPTQFWKWPAPALVYTSPIRTSLRPLYHTDILTQTLQMHYTITMDYLQNLKNTSLTKENVSSILSQNELYVKLKILTLSEKAVRNLEAALDSADTSTKLLESAKEVLAYLGITNEPTNTIAQENLKAGAQIASASILTALKGIASMFSIDISESKQNPKKTSKKKQTPKDPPKQEDPKTGTKISESLLRSLANNQNL